MKLAKHTILVGPAIAGLLLFAQPAAAQWTGCGAGVHGGLVVASVDLQPSPFNIGAQGQAAGLAVNCDYKMGAFVGGIHAEYSWIFGDLNTIGVEADTTLGGRLGVLINAGSLLYAHAGWTQLDTKIGDMDGWKIGLGNEFRVPNSPLYLDLRYTYAQYDLSDLAPGATVDAEAHTFRIGLNVKFGPGMFGGSGARFATDDPAPRVGVAPAKKCDPKLANC